VRSNNAVNADARASTVPCICFPARAGYWERWRHVPTSLQCPVCGFNVGFEAWKGYCGVGRLITMEK